MLFVLQITFCAWFITFIIPVTNTRLTIPTVLKKTVLILIDQLCFDIEWNKCRSNG